MWVLTPLVAGAAVWYVVFFLWPCIPIWRAGGRVYRRGSAPLRCYDNWLGARVAEWVFWFRIWHVDFSDQPITDSDLVHLLPVLQRFPGLKKLTLNRTRVTGTGLLYLSELRLSRIHVEQLRFTTTQAAELSRRRRKRVEEERGNGQLDRDLSLVFYSQPRSDGPGYLESLDEIWGRNGITPSCSRCNCLLRDYAGDNSRATFGTMRHQLEGVLCVNCRANDGKAYLFCDACLPPASGQQCPNCGEFLTPLFEKEILRILQWEYEQSEKSRWR